MRQETNNEMDLLLRRLGRQDTAAPDDHLDPDELNSYAENVLPPAARARYTEHLAECARCRDLVVQLSSSAGVVVAPARVSEPSTLRKFLASLFSPMVLRYAVPALGLVVVAAIGFRVLRQEGTVSYAPVAEQGEQPQPAQGRVAASEPQTSSSLEKDSRGFVDTTKSVNKPAVQGDTGAETGAAAPPLPPNAPPVVSITTEVQDAAKKVEREQQEEAKEAAPAPKGTPAIAELKTLEPVQKQAAENRAVANEPAAEKAKTESNAADAAAASPRRARSRDEGRGLTALGGATTQGAKRDDAAEKDQDEAVIRTVAGRRFRKQGNVWIDSDHSSSRVVTSVTRDSEQYRALVADEPAIKQIADALDGEIIVVWKGRAYRIR